MSPVGIHSSARIHKLPPAEKSIVEAFGRFWYVTAAGMVAVRRGNAEYCYFLIRPCQTLSRMFGIHRELMCVLSRYDNFQMRTLEAFDMVKEGLEKLRAETMCRVLITNDEEVRTTLLPKMNEDPEVPVTVPLTYGELEGAFDKYVLINRFRELFYARDLFSFRSPLKTELYFFGRGALIHDVIARQAAGEHTGLFGLRKSGKTSIIYAIERQLTARNRPFVSIDCESPSVHLCRWNELVHKVVQLYAHQRGTKLKDDADGRYSEKRAAESFEADMLQIYRSRKKLPAIVIFDEIERISPDTGSSEHWRLGDDFIYFWQTLRGFYQRHPGVFTYILVGTNPSSVEAPSFHGQDNPLFGSVEPRYLPPFTFADVKEMVTQLGHYMGMEFEELTLAKMTEDFGGHPFLIRQFCSCINRLLKGARPATVDKALYERAMAQFAAESTQYLEDIVNVLRQWYPDEYDMLTWLATNNTVEFEQFARAHEQYVKHLLSYGLVNRSANGWSFNIEAIREHLARKHVYERRHLTQEEKLSEISLRRNRIEKGLRTLIRNTLRVHYGPNAGEIVLNALPTERRGRMKERDVRALLHRDDSPLYFSDLKNVVQRQWNEFDKVFDMPKEKVMLALSEINEAGRPDAHARGISEDDFTQVRLHFKKIENVLEAWAD